MSIPTRRPWCRKELIVAFRLYCLLPFGRLHQRTAEIIELAAKLNRTPSSVAMKLVNLASLDPAIAATGRKGLGNASESDRKIWQEFHADWESLEEESHQVLERIGYEGIVEEPNENSGVFEGTSREGTVQIRQGQGFFRKAILASYGGRCCMSGLADPNLIVASHIIPWAADRRNRLNPQNGLCLSALHDRAYDRGLITVQPDLRIRVSPSLRQHGENELVRIWLLGIEGRQIQLPDRFRPEPEFLAWHEREIYQAG